MSSYAFMHPNDTKWSFNWTNSYINQWKSDQTIIGTDNANLRLERPLRRTMTADDDVNAFLRLRRPRLQRPEAFHGQNNARASCPNQDWSYPVQNQTHLVCTNLDATTCVRWRRQIKFKCKTRILMRMFHPRARNNLMDIWQMDPICRI